MTSLPNVLLLGLDKQLNSTIHKDGLHIAITESLMIRPLVAIKPDYTRLHGLSISQPSELRAFAIKNVDIIDAV